MDSVVNNSINIKDYTLDNYYSCLSPPPCQVEEQEHLPIIRRDPQDVQILGGKGAVRFELPITKSKSNKWKARVESRHLAKQNKQALKATRDTQYREIPWADMKVALEARNGKESELSTALAVSTLASLRRAKRDKASRKELVYVIDFNDDEMRCGVLNGTIPSTVKDSAASSSVGMKDDPCLRTGLQSNKVFILPNGQAVAASEIAEYPFQLRNPASQVHITPGITSNSLMSTNQLALAGYISVFDKEEVNVYDANDVKITVTRGAILRGWRCPLTGLWRIPLCPTIRSDNVTNVNTQTVLIKQPPSEILPKRPPPAEAIANVFELRTQPELVRYYHAAAGFPTKPTWLAAIKNNQFASWTGLTYEGVRKYYPESEETWKGHGKKVKSGLRSTKRQIEADDAVIKLEDDVERDAHYKQSSQVYKKSKTIMVRVMQVDVDDEGKEFLRLIYTDGTGRFPKQSRTGMNYIMVLAENDSDAILVEGMKNRSAGEMVRAYNVLIARLHACGIFPTKQVLDNEISQSYKEAIASHNIEYELVPPHNHERNKAERAIQTYKNHFVSILCGADKDFPLYLWSDILRQAEHTLNLLRPSRRLPSV